MLRLHGTNYVALAANVLGSVDLNSLALQSASLPKGATFLQNPHAPLKVSVAHNSAERLADQEIETSLHLFLDGIEAHNQATQ